MQKYVVGFTVADARNLKTASGEPCDPFVQVECCGSKWQTTTKEQKLQHVPWNENHIWPNIQLYPGEFESAYIEFSVYARNWFSRNELIGKVSLQLASVNKRQGHVYAKKTLYLKAQGGTETRGMINLTVFCLKPGESAPSESQQNGTEQAQEFQEGEIEDEDVSKLVLGKMEAPMGRPYHVHISIYRVENLAPMGGWNPNPFVTVEYAGACVKTTQASDVEQYTWNECARIPVQTPVYEDTILIKLWHHNTFSADELIAQGLVSFSELRNNALPPRWFCLYGWDLDEVADIKALAIDGEVIQPNFFKGKLLISGRVERLHEGEEMQPAGIIAARPSVEPATFQVALFADVYEVSGAVGRECQVQLAFGRQHKETAQWVTPGSEKQVEERESGDNVQHDQADREHINVFSFSQVQGRIDPLLLMTPEETDSQPFVMINVFTRGVLSGQSRVAYQKRRLNDFAKYELGSPAKPRFVAMEAMPHNTKDRISASVLMTIERHTTADVPRHNRKNVKPMSYIVRAYVFMGRNISRDTAELPNYAIRVACAGVSKSTEERNEVRPMWFTTLELKVTLSSDHPKEPPTMEPITVTLVDQTTIMGAKRQSDLGKTVCTYEYMRQKDSMGQWEPYKLRPQWIVLNGGNYGGKAVAEVLVCFELLQYKYRHEPELACLDMWPCPPDQYRPEKHFARLRKATLHFSLYGLRDVWSAGISDSPGMEPIVVIQVKKFTQEAHKANDPQEKYYQAVFKYKDLIANGEIESKWDRLQKWRSECNGRTDCWNYEFFKIRTIRLHVPDEAVLEPFINIKVLEQPSTMMSMYRDLLGQESRKEGDGTLIGEHRRCLSGYFPCYWYPQIKRDRPYEEQVPEIKKQLRKFNEAAKAQQKFVEESREDREKLTQAGRERRLDEHKREIKQAILMVEEMADAVDSAALPREMRLYHAKTNPVGRRENEQVKLVMAPSYMLNMKQVKGFEPKPGAPIQKKTEDKWSHVINGKLEDYDDEMTFQNDFIFKNMPLLKNHDLWDANDPTDWNFRPSECFGFVKCAFKLVDGWEDDVTAATPWAKMDLADLPPILEAELVAEDRDLMDAGKTFVTREDFEKLGQSFGIPDHLNSAIFDENKFTRMFKSKENVPSQVRARIYFVQAICIFGKGQTFGDPYLAFRLGKETLVSMRNMVQYNTNTPTFYRVEERDFDMPLQSRLQVDIVDHASEAVIGSTVIDLEDRWHSNSWKHADERRRIPKENRPLYDSAAKTGGIHNNGSVELWIEMLDSVKASDRKATELRRPPPVEVEIRLIIRTTTNVKIVDGNHTDVKIGVDLDCAEYMGEDMGFPKSQFTDVHLGSKDGNAEFNWRIVFPRIVMPTKSCTLDIQLYDANFMAGDTFIGSVQIDLRRYVEKVAKEMDMIDKGADLKFTNSTNLKSSEGEETDNGEPECVGQVQFQLQVMTQSEATQKRAGKGREDPNEFPQLVTPTEGRGWGDVFAGVTFELPNLGFYKKVIPLIIFTLLCLVALKFIGLL